MSANALLKFNTKRARRMTEDEARAQLVSLGFDLDGAASVADPGDRSPATAAARPSPGCSTAAPPTPTAARAGTAPC